MTNMIRRVWGLLSVALSLALIPVRAACDASESNGLQPSLTIRSFSNPLAAKTQDGHSLDISQTPGWRVIYFWSTACPCVTACEKYSFLPLAQKYKGRVSFFAVASDGYDLNLAKSDFDKGVESHHLPYPVLRDTTHTLAKFLDARVTPQTFVLDPQGIIVFSGMPDDSRRFLNQDAKMVKGKVPVVPQTYLSRALGEALAGKPVTQSPIKYDGCIIAW